ncbi:PHD-finger protein [Ceratobasidium theobromae]|uniref:Chromatin modification-related protein n=1 Tax=Ceratobasidium theobromae TaxID=1582974 RepID=A0A5N5QV93_9AGAM|nr:PHD-finger protein [Ceratobasidium theobromae]
MKRKRGVPKAAVDGENAVVLIPQEQEKPETEAEDPAVVEWNAFAQDHYELVEQLPLSLHRSFSLMRELDDLAQGNTTRILPATRAYIALRETCGPRPRHKRAPSGLDLLAHVSASVEPPPVTSPNVPTSSSPIEPLPATSAEFPQDSRKLLTLIATLASEAVRASSEKLGIANAVYHTVDNHLTALNALIAQHRATLPRQPTPTPPPAPQPVSPVPPLASSPSLKIRTRRRALQEQQAPHADDIDVDAGDEPHETIPPLRLTRTIPTSQATNTPTTIRIRGKPKPKDDEPAGRSVSTRPRSVSTSKGVSGSGSVKGGPGGKPATAPKNSTGSNKAPTGKHASGPKAASKPPAKNSNKSADGDTEMVDADETPYCYCRQPSFGEMIACDATDCPREWFHLPCVGLDKAPTATEWFCKDCAKNGYAKEGRKRRRKG